jgi:hypothetical protein
MQSSFFEDRRNQGERSAEKQRNIATPTIDRGGAIASLAREDIEHIHSKEAHPFAMACLPQDMKVVRVVVRESAQS